MFVAYLALGVVTGLAAAIMTLFAGHGFLLAFAAYVLGGMAGVAAGVIWLLLPTNNTPAPQPIPQRS